MFFGISPIFSHTKIEKLAEFISFCITMDFVIERRFMSYTNKTLEELNVLDDFLMNAIVVTPVLGEAFCRNVLTVLSLFLYRWA